MKILNVKKKKRKKGKSSDRNLITLNSKGFVNK